VWPCTQLRARGQFHASANDRDNSLDLGIGRDVGHPCQRTKPQLSALDIDAGPCRVEESGLYSDDVRGASRSSSHQIEHFVPPASGAEMSASVNDFVISQLVGQRLHRRRGFSAASDSKGKRIRPILFR